MEINSLILTIIFMANCGAGGGHSKHSLRTRMGRNALENIKYIYKLKKLRKKENAHKQTANMEEGIWNLFYRQHSFVKYSSILGYDTDAVWISMAVTMA